MILSIVSFCLQMFLLINLILQLADICVFPIDGVQEHAIHCDTIRVLMRMVYVFRGLHVFTMTERILLFLSVLRLESLSIFVFVLQFALQIIYSPILSNLFLIEVFLISDFHAALVTDAHFDTLLHGCALNPWLHV